MRITCPHCGARDAQEFSILGAADPQRPNGLGATMEAMTAYVHERENVAGLHRELWYHGAGCHAWLVVTRDTRTHDVASVALASDKATSGAAA